MTRAIVTKDLGGHEYHLGAGTTPFLTPNNHFSGVVPQQPSDGSAGTTRFITPNKHFSSVVPQEPSDGSVGTMCFERQFHKSDGFCGPPRAPFIILIKARGMPESPLPRTPHRLISIIKEGGGKSPPAQRRGQHFVSDAHMHIKAHVWKPAHMHIYLYLGGPRIR